MGLPEGVFLRGSPVPVQCSRCPVRIFRVPCFCLLKSVLDLRRVMSCRVVPCRAVSRHATTVCQGNWFSVTIGPVPKATQ